MAKKRGNILTGTISVSEAASRIGVSNKTVRKMLHNGQLKGSLVGVGRGTWRISEDHVEELCQMKFYHCGHPMEHDEAGDVWVCQVCNRVIGQ